MDATRGFFVPASREELQAAVQQNLSSKKEGTVCSLEGSKYRNHEI